MVLETLAECYPQLYLKPGEGMEDAYKDAALRGNRPENHSLELFLGSDRDSLTEEQTPAGPVNVLYLYRREDFENALRLLVYRCRPEEIPPTVGAMTVNGLANWKKINDHRTAYFAAGHTDWAEEWKRFTADKRNYRDILILLSDGPYSGVSAERAGVPQEGWLEISRKIRLYHECTHVICRRLFPQQKEAVWDEVVADAIGIRKALGRYDAKLAGLFLGVSEDGYMGGRLENYIPEKRMGSLPDIAAKVYDLTKWIEQESLEKQGIDSWDFLMYLQERQDDIFRTK